MMHVSVCSILQRTNENFQMHLQDQKQSLKRGRSEPDEK